MNWTQATIYTSAEGIDPLCTALSALGLDSFSIEDGAEFAQFLSQQAGNWDYIDEELLDTGRIDTNVKVYIPKDENGKKLLSDLRLSLDTLRERDSAGLYGRLELLLDDVSDSDWENNWKKYFKPFAVGEKILICPSWENAGADGRLILRIDPGSSFGTGQHATTKLCLELLERQVYKNCEMLDMGCGSGILSVAALLLGAGHVTAVDIDEAAISSSAENFSLNGLDALKYTLLNGNIIYNGELADLLGRRRYDIITANIVADVIIDMTELFAALIKPTGTLIISGVIEHRAEEVFSALERGRFKVGQSRESDGWVAALLRVRDA